MRLHTDGPFKGHWRHGYGLVYADPPWRQETWGATNAKAPPYPTMTLAEMIELDVNSLCQQDCHMAMWTTHPHLAQSLALMKAWGFVYSTVLFTWLKTNRDGSLWRGMGKTTRKNTELVILGRHGSPKRYATNLDEVVMAGVIPQPDAEHEHEVITGRRMEHSVKPGVVRDRLDQYVGAETRKIELFARRNDRPGWSAWGNQTSLYNGIPDHD